MLRAKLQPFFLDIEENSKLYTIDPAFIGAMIIQESGGDPWKPRFEPHYYTKQKFSMPNIFANKIGISTETEKVLQSSSWGLMQIMGVVARELGYTDNLTKLILPETGLRWGCIKLRSLINKHGGNVDLAISAYNKGTPVADDPYMYSVKTLYATLKKEGM